MLEALLKSEKRSSKTSKGMVFGVGGALLRWSFFIAYNSGPHRIADKLFSNTRYFVIKSNNFENVEIAKSKVGS